MQHFPSFPLLVQTFELDLDLIWKFWIYTCTYGMYVEDNYYYYFLFAHMPLYITVVMHECILVWKSLVH